MPTMVPLIVIFMLINSLNLVSTLPGGAPATVCDTLLPFHGGGIPPMSTTSPFSIVTGGTAVAQGQTIRIEIDPVPPELTFGGFMIHARSRNPPYHVVGRFAPSADGLVKLINCGGNDNTATHTSPSPKSKLGLEWQAPNDFIGEVVFNATVAQEYAKFWVGIESNPVQVLQKGSVVPSSGGISTTRRPISPTAVRPLNTVQTAIDSDPIYSGCGQTKTCLGLPDGCIGDKSCKAVASVLVRGDQYEFEMKSGHENPAYVAVGLSTDDRMGQDSVIECIPQQGRIQAYTSWTLTGPYGVSRENVPQNIIKLVNASYADGTIYCRVQRDAISTVRDTKFDLINNRYHLLIAIGSSVQDNSVGYHDLGRMASGQSLFLSDISELTGSSKVLLRIHGAFMLIAWIGTASVGIIFARYFKQTWVGSSMCGKDQWFAWHRVFMVTTWTLTLAAFVIIFVEIDGWSAEQNPHAILGTITTVICFLQPIGALFRPSPNHKNRPIFNWTHWLGGNLAHIIGIVTIFFAVKLTKAELPEWFDWILVAFVAFHVTMHFLLSIAGCMSDKSHTQRVNSFPMADISSQRNSIKERKMDAPYAGLRKILLTIYLIIILLFVIALVVIAVLAPIEDSYESIKTKLTS